jgi:hypothetical protein
VAQSAYQTGGTWDGTVKNLRFGWSPVFVYGDGSKAQQQLCEMGAQAVELDQLRDLTVLVQSEKNLLDM